MREMTLALLLRDEVANILDHNFNTNLFICFGSEISYEAMMVE